MEQKCIRQYLQNKELFAKLDDTYDSSNYGYSSFLDSLEKEPQEQLNMNLYQNNSVNFPIL